MWWIHDNSGYLFSAMTYFLIFSEAFCAYKLGIEPLAYENYINLSLHLYCLLFLVTLTIWSHISCMTTCPTSFSSVPGPTKLCEKCKKQCSIQAHHCSVCKVCIIRMQHHCPWVNNCIGLYNMKSYILFLLYTLLISCYSLCILFTRSVVCMTHSYSAICRIEYKYFLNDLNLGVMFMLFNCSVFSIVVLLLSQHVLYILLNTSHIDVLKSRRPVQRSYYSNLIETFGGKLGLSWMLAGMGRVQCLAVEYLG